MRFLWISTAFMVAAGVVVTVAGLAGFLEPIAIVLGVLLFWSGIVKVVVLRIWRSSLRTAPLPPDATSGRTRGQLQ